MNPGIVAVGVKYRRKGRLLMSVPFTSSEVFCPECRRPMVELAKYQRAIDGDSILGDATPAPIGPAGRAFFLLSIFDFVLDAISMALHQSKAKKLCARELPQFPNSLICPKCLFLIRRK